MEKMVRKPLFKERESILTHVFQTFFGQFVVSLYIISSTYYLINKIISYLVEESSWNEDWGLVSYTFKGFHYSLVLWMSYHVIVLLLVYPLVSRYGHFKSFMIPLVSSLFLSFFITISYLSVVLLDTGPSTRISIAFETVRICAKILSFVITVYDLKKKRKPFETEEENANLILRDHENNFCESSSQNVTSIAHFLYFLFAPTGIYAPSYPKTKTTNWSRFFLLHYINLTIFLFGLKIVQESFLPLSSVGLKPIPITLINRQIFIFLAITQPFHSLAFLFIGGQHNWCNSWAELLKFSDREFYTDHWSVTNARDWFSRWNRIMQNYLYYIVYSPVNKYSRCKLTSSVVTMAFSGFLFHDFPLFVVFGFEYVFPVYTLVFVLSAFKTRGGDDNSKSKTSKLISLIVFYIKKSLHGLLFLFFVLELYSRNNCKRPEGTSLVADLLLPRLVSCASIHWEA